MSWTLRRYGPYIRSIGVTYQPHSRPHTWYVSLWAWHIVVEVG